MHTQCRPPAAQRQQQKGLVRRGPPPAARIPPAQQRQQDVASVAPWRSGGPGRRPFLHHRVLRAPIKRVAGAPVLPGPLPHFPHMLSTAAASLCGTAVPSSQCRVSGAARQRRAVVRVQAVAAPAGAMKVLQAQELDEQQLLRATARPRIDFTSILGTVRLAGPCSGAPPTPAAAAASPAAAARTRRRPVPDPHLSGCCCAGDPHRGECAQPR